MVILVPVWEGGAAGHTGQGFRAIQVPGHQYKPWISSALWGSVRTARTVWAHRGVVLALPLFSIFR